MIAPLPRIAPLLAATLSALTALTALFGCASTPARPPALERGEGADTSMEAAQRPALPPPSSSGVIEVTLRNGLQVLLLEDHSAPVATFSLFYRVGSRNETAGATGSAHLLEHMLFKGTKRFGKGQIMATLDAMGARWNATTFYDYTNYFETFPSDRLEEVLDLEADRMQHSLIADEERDLERIVVRNELERGENSPVRALLQALWATSFQAHPYHHPVIGWRPDVEGVPTSELRRFYEAWYRPANATALLVGDFSAPRALELIEHYFGAIPSGGPFPAVHTVEAPQEGERRLVLRRPGAVQVVALGYRAPEAASPDTAALKVLQLILAGDLSLSPFGDSLDPGIGNRLHQALVESELATGAGADFIPMRDPGLFTLIAVTNPQVTHQKVEDALRAELAKLRDRLVSPEELARAKARAEVALGFMKDGTSARAMLLGYFAALGDWKLADGFDARVRAVTAEEVQRVARKYLVDSACTTGWFIPTQPAAGKPAALLPRSGQSALAAHHAEGGLSAEAMRGAAPSAAKIAPRVRRVVLKNGATLLVLGDASSGSATFSLAGSLKAGGVFDPAGASGTAELTAEMMMRGTKLHDKLTIARQLEEVGASLSYSAGSETVGFGARGLVRDLDRVLALLAETLAQPAFSKDEVAKLKRETEAQLRQAEDSTAHRANRAFYQQLYPKGHPYYVESLEEALASLGRITPQSLAAFHKNYYRGGGLIVALVGGFETETVLAKLDAHLSKLPEGGARVIEIPEVPIRGDVGRQVVEIPGKANVDVIVGHQSNIKRTSPDYYAASLGNFIFGGSTSARLFQEVRDRMGLTYSVYSGLDARHGAGPFSVELSLNPQNVEKALAEVTRLMRELAERGVTERELALAKQTLIGRYKVGLATNAGVAGALASFASYGLPVEMIDEHPERLSEVSLAEVNRLMATLIHPERAITVIAGTLQAR